MEARRIMFVHDVSSEDSLKGCLKSGDYICQIEVLVNNMGYFLGNIMLPLEESFMKQIGLAK